MNTLITSVSKMRYETAGDYFEKDGLLTIQIFDQGNPDHNFLIALHEFVEQYLTQKRGITNEQIDAFDFEYEKNRQEGDDTSEPGDHPDCPYRDEHRFAMIVEQLMAHELGVDWHDYDQNIKVYEEPAD
jgi:hypothetical protein